MSTTEEITDAEVAEVLEQSLALMNNEGAHWMQGHYKKGEGANARYCSVGAVRQVAGYYDEYLTDSQCLDRSFRISGQGIVALAETLRERGLYDRDYSNRGNVIEWNDSPARTWSDIVSLFTATIKRLRGEE